MQLTEPRIRPRSESEWSADVDKGIRAFGVDPASASNLLMTLAHHPSSLNGIGPLARFIRNDSTVAGGDQVLLGLRSAWLCDSDAIWSELASEVRSVDFSARDLRLIAKGSDAGWGEWDATVLRGADELYRDSFLSDETWATLASRYDAKQLLEVVFTGAEYIMLSMMANSFGVQPNERFAYRLPRDIPRHVRPARATPVQLDEARLAPIPMDKWTDDVRQLLDPNDTGRPTLNLYMTLACHPDFYRPRAVQSVYIRAGSTLSGRAREILTLHIGWLCGAEYEWAQHIRAARRVGLTNEEIRRIAIGSDAPGWDPVEADLIRAADGLHRGATISSYTWKALAARYGTPELIDVVITVAGYRMVSMALNSLGTQLEPDREGFPNLGVRARD